MRVLLINQFFFPDEAATSQFLTDLAIELRDEGHKVEVICGRTKYRPGGVDQSTSGITIHRVWSTDLRGCGGLAAKAFNYLTFLCSAALRLAWLNPSDVVITLSTPPMLGLFGISAKKMGHRRFFFWVQDIYPEIAESLGVLRCKPVNSFFQTVMSSVYKAADRVIVLGEDMKQKLAGLYPVAEKIVVVHHWPLSETVDDYDREADRKRRGWNRDFVVLYSGNLGRAHDVATFLEAFRMFSAGNPDARLVIAGEGHRKGEVAEFARRHPELRIDLLPHQPREELADFLASADVHLASQLPAADCLVVPSKIYGIMESGRPLCFVGSPSNEVAGLLKKHSFGVRVDPGDAATLSSALERLRRDRSLADSMGRNARQLARGPFSRRAGLAKLVLLVEET